MGRRDRTRGGDGRRDRGLGDKAFTWPWHHAPGGEGELVACGQVVHAQVADAENGGAAFRRGSSGRGEACILNDLHDEYPAVSGYFADPTSKDQRGLLVDADTVPRAQVPHSHNQPAQPAASVVVSAEQDVLVDESQPRQADAVVWRRGALIEGDEDGLKAPVSESLAVRPKEARPDACPGGTGAQDDCHSGPFSVRDAAKCLVERIADYASVKYERFSLDETSKSSCYSLCCILIACRSPRSRT